MNATTVTTSGTVMKKPVIKVRRSQDNTSQPACRDGSQKRDFNHVDDVTDAFLRAGASDAADGQVLNLGDTHPISLIDLVTLLLDVAGGGSYKLVPFPPERKRIDIGDFYADISLVQKTLGWAPRKEWRRPFRANWEWWQAVFEPDAGVRL